MMQAPLHRDIGGKSCLRCPEAAHKRGNHKKIKLLLQHSAAPSKAKAVIQYLEGERFTSPAPTKLPSLLNYDHLTFDGYLL